MDDDRTPYSHCLPLVYVWLFYHSMEQYYPNLKSLGVSSVPELLQMTEEDVASDEAFRR